MDLKGSGRGSCGPCPASPCTYAVEWLTQVGAHQLGPACLLYYPEKRQFAPRGGSPSHHISWEVASPHLGCAWCCWEALTPHPGVDPP